MGKFQDYIRKATQPIVPAVHALQIQQDQILQVQEQQIVQVQDILKTLVQNN